MSAGRARSASSAGTRTPAAPISGEDHEPVAAQRVRHADQDLRRPRQLAAQVVEHVLEDRDDEHEHEREHERREGHDDDRVDHRALHAAPERVLLLDLDRDAVEHAVERPGRLAGLDHRHEEPVEDLRMARERLREHHARLDVGAHLADHLAQVLVVGLLLERRQCRDHADPGLDHRRELPREDLQRLRLDPLEPRRGPFAARGPLGERPREQAARAKLVAGRRRVGGVDLAAHPEALGVDCFVGVCGHCCFLSIWIRSRASNVDVSRTKVFDVVTPSRTTTVIFLTGRAPPPEHARRRGRPGEGADRAAPRDVRVEAIVPAVGCRRGRRGRSAVGPDEAEAVVCTGVHVGVEDVHVASVGTANASYRVVRRIAGVRARPASRFRAGCCRKLSARYASICLSASVPAVPVRLALFSATMPELKPATIAVIPTAITVIAISSSITPKPASDEVPRRARRIRPPRRSIAPC